MKVSVLWKLLPVALLALSLLWVGCGGEEAVPESSRKSATAAAGKLAYESPREAEKRVEKAENALEKAKKEGSELYAQETYEEAAKTVEEAKKAVEENKERAARKLAEKAEKLVRDAKRETRVNIEKGTTYTVRKGDNLWDLSESDFAYNNPWVWPLIWKANDELIENPHLIKIGWELKIPGRSYTEEDIERSKRLIWEAEQMVERGSGEAGNLDAPAREVYAKASLM